MAAYRPKTTDNVGTLWRSSHVFGAAWLAVIEGRYRKQPSDTMDSAKHIPLFHFLDFADFNAHLPERCELIGVECVVGARMLPGYHHPERAVYLFGPEDGSIPAEILERCHSRLRIPGNHCLNLAAAGSIIAYDRVAKSTPPSPPRP